MKFWTTTLLLFLLPAAAVHATLTPSCATTTTTTSTPPAAAFFHGSMSSTLTTASSSAHLLLQLRGGGELHHPETAEDVDALILNASSNNQLVVIDFTASWCGPCKMIAPLFQEMAEEMDSVVFLKVDVDENPETAARYSVSAMPTFLFIKQGEVIDRLMGANASRLQELIQEHM